MQTHVFLDGQPGEYTPWFLVTAPSHEAARELAKQVTPSPGPSYTACPRSLFHQVGATNPGITLIRYEAVQSGRKEAYTTHFLRQDNGQEVLQVPGRVENHTKATLKPIQ